jgi:hypothetical protein
MPESSLFCDKSTVAYALKSCGMEVAGVYCGLLVFDRKSSGFVSVSLFDGTTRIRLADLGLRTESEWREFFKVDEAERLRYISQDDFDSVMGEAT